MAHLNEVIQGKISKFLNIWTYLRLVALSVGYRRKNDVRGFVWKLSHISKDSRLHGSKQIEDLDKYFIQILIFYGLFYLKTNEIKQ